MDECVQSTNYWLLSVLCMDPEEARRGIRMQGIFTQWNSNRDHRKGRMEAIDSKFRFTQVCR